MAKGYKLPDNLTPDGDICIPVFVPDDYDYIMTFHKHIRRLTLDWTWQRDDNYSANIVRQQWMNRTYAPLLDALMDGTPCGTGDTGSSIASCYTIDTLSDAIEFYPNDPFNSDPYDPILFGGQWSRWENTDIENSDIWQFVEETLSEALGYYPNDIFVFPKDLPNRAFAGWGEFIDDLTEFWFPYLQFQFTGSGEIDIELLNFPLGGSVFIIPDTELTFDGILSTLRDIIDNDGAMPASWISTDLDRGIPFDNASTQGQNVIFSEEGDHVLTLVFVPRIVPLNAPFVFPFGGFRRIEVCGDITFTGTTTGQPIDKTNAQTTINQNRGIIMGTYQDFLDALDAHEIRKAMRYLLASADDNIKNDIQIDADDLTTTIKGATGGSMFVLPSGIPSDDIVYGGGYEVGVGFQTIVSEIILRRDTQARTAQNVADILRYSYVMRGIVDTVDYLLTALGTPFTDATDTVTPTVNPVDIANLVYCHGANKQTLYRYAQDIEDANGTDAQHIADWYRLLIAEIEQEQIDNWYNIGTQSPRLGYDGADCYRIAPVTKTITYDMAIWNVALDNFWTGMPLNHLWRISVKCLTPFVDASGNEFDGVYYSPAQGNVALYSPVIASGVYGFNYVESFGGQQDIGKVYSAEINRATVAPRSLRYGLSNTWTAGKAEITLVDLGVLP